MTSENVPNISGLTLTRGYDAIQRQNTRILEGTLPLQSVSYTYNTHGIIDNVADGGWDLAYTYTAGHDRLASAAITSGNNSVLNIGYSYDTMNRLTGVTGTANSVDHVYGYTLNAKNQRTALSLPDGTSWGYAYDALNQVGSGGKLDAQSQPIAGQQYSYLYDLIGNRTSAELGSSNNSVSYTANLVNQYTLVNAAVPTYDADGNMLTHGDWTYTYNAENRLVKAESDDVKVECDYDYMGRRIWKKVYDKGLLGLDWSLNEHRRFVYDGYKLVAEFDALNSDALLANYLWQPVGMDVPLMRTANSVNEYVVADGNKNVIELRSATGVVTDTYDYTPFGDVTHSGGSDNPFCFSSEYHDSETGLVYYNYRYYLPTLGRWINRYPIEEQGGANLYGMVSNKPVNVWDKLGLTDYLSPFSPDNPYSILNPNNFPSNVRSGCCGADVTDRLSELLRRVQQELSQPGYKNAMSSRTYNHSDGWDIEEFKQAGSGACDFGGSSGTDCAQTVTYKGQCVKATSLNYILYGVLTKISAKYPDPRNSIYWNTFIAWTYIAIGRPITLIGITDAEDEPYLAGVVGRMDAISSGYYDRAHFVNYTQCSTKNVMKYDGALTASIRISDSGTKKQIRVP